MFWNGKRVCKLIHRNNLASKSNQIQVRTGTIKLSANVTLDTTGTKIEVSLEFHGAVTIVYRKTSMEYLGLLDYTTGNALGRIAKYAVNFEAFIPEYQSDNSSGKSAKTSKSCQVYIWLYGSRQSFEEVGVSLSEDKTFLQHP